MASEPSNPDRIALNQPLETSQSASVRAMIRPRAILRALFRAA